MKVLMIYPEIPNTFWSFNHALKFINKKASSPPLGLITVAAMLPTDWELKLIDMNVTPLTDADLEWADLLFVSAMVVQTKSAHEVFASGRKHQKTIVAGGPLFTEDYPAFENEADHFVLNEGEITLPLFLKDFLNGNPQKIYKSSEFPEITETPVPLWELADIHQYESLSIQFSRGCPFNCDFCNITSLLGHRPRLKSAKQIIAELDKMYELGWRRNVFFVDDNFIGNKKFLKQEILPALINWRKGKVGYQFITEASINLADDPELMDMMVQAGFISVFIGIETPADESLNECQKNQNRNRDLLQSVKTIQKHCLQVMGGFIVGFDNDTETIFKRQIEFIQKSGIVTAMVGLLQAPTGTKLYKRMESEGRIIREMSGDNTDGTSNIIPVMDQQVLQAGYYAILKDIYSPKAFYERVGTFLSNYKPSSASVKIDPSEILAFFKTIWHMGIIGKERKYYWKLFFHTLFKDTKNFPLAITFTVYGYHFRKIFEDNLKQAQRQGIPV